MTIADAAALGLITPALLEWARAHGIKRVVDIPQDIADIEKLKPLGDCGKEEHRNMQNKVKEKCQNIGLRGCKPNMSKEELEANLKKNQECVEARAKINKLCFRWGNLGHQKRLAAELNAIKNCEEFLAKCK